MLTVTCEWRAMALPLSWLKRFFPMTFLVRTTMGANSPFPSLTFFIIGRGLTGLVETRTWVGSTNCSSPIREVSQPPRKDERRPAPLTTETEVAIEGGLHWADRREWITGMVLVGLWREPEIFFSLSRFVVLMVVEREKTVTCLEPHNSSVGLEY